MELIFQERKLDYLSRVLCETVLLEQTADVIVPDSYPDAERVVDAFGTLLIRNAECTGSSLSVAGTVQAGVIFVTEDGEVQCLQTQIPFSARKELPAERQDCTLQCKCMLRSVDARPLNSRKLLVRVGVSCTMMAYSKEEGKLCEIAEPSENLQLRRTELPLRMPLALTEKNFAINEELELPTSRPAISQLLKAVVRMQVNEQKNVGNKAVFKGNLHVHALYADRDEKLHTHDWDLPFSQYAEFEQEMDEAELQTVPALTGFDVEPDSQVECRRLFLSANVLAQCSAIGEKKLALIEDAFCTDAELKPQWEEWEMYGLLDRQSFRETALATSEEAASSVVDAWVYPDEMSRERDGAKMQLRLPLTCNILYYDAEGNLQGRSMHPTVSFETELNERGGCRMNEIDCGEVYCNAGANGIELRVPVQASVESYANHHLRAVCGGEVTELQHDRARKPAVVLRRTDADEEVWEIAKACRAPLKAILQANGLESPTVPANTMLLIPM